MKTERQQKTDEAKMRGRVRQAAAVERKVQSRLALENREYAYAECRRLAGEVRTLRTSVTEIRDLLAAFEERVTADLSKGLADEIQRRR